MSKVFVAGREMRFDATDARQFGRVVYLSDRMRGNLNAFDAQGRLAAFANALKAESFDPDEDVLAVAGPTLFVSLLVGAAMSLHGRANLLVFEKGKGYVHRTVSTASLLNASR